jgi:hypothetical protein
MSEDGQAVRQLRAPRRRDGRSSPQPLPPLRDCQPVRDLVDEDVRDTNVERLAFGLARILVPSPYTNGVMPGVTRADDDSVERLARPVV